MAGDAEIVFAWREPGVDDVPTVYLAGAYQQLFADHDGGRARVLHCSRAGRSALLPLLVREIGPGVHEAYSAYGYGGLAGDLSLSPHDLERLRGFLAAAGIVCVFVRHAPFLGNQARWPSEFVELNRRTYAALLPSESSFEAYLDGLPQKLRWSVRFALRGGMRVDFTPLDVCPAPRLDAFYRLYAGLMCGKKTGEYYLFSAQFFRAHAQRLGGACELAEITDPATGEPVAAALFLLDARDWTHYHLSAASPAGMKAQAMELLLAAACHRYGSRGYRRLHLGGGHALDETDGLSRFKRKFAHERLDFACSRLVCDGAAYARERERLPLAHPSFFLVGDARGACARAQREREPNPGPAAP